MSFVESRFPTIPFLPSTVRLGAEQLLQQIGTMKEATISLQCELRSPQDLDLCSAAPTESIGMFPVGVFNLIKNALPSEGLEIRGRYDMYVCFCTVHW